MPFGVLLQTGILSRLSTDATHQTTNDGPQKRLSPTGDNLPNVIQYLQERYPERLEKIISMLSNRVPRLEKVDTELTMSGRRQLKIKDAPFEQPIFGKVRLRWYIEAAVVPDVVP